MRQSYDTSFLCLPDMSPSVSRCLLGWETDWWLHSNDPSPSVGAPRKQRDMSLYHASLTCRQRAPSHTASVLVDVPSPPPLSRATRLTRLRISPQRCLSPWQRISPSWPCLWPSSPSRYPEKRTVRGSACLSGVSTAPALPRVHRWLFLA